MKILLVDDHSVVREGVRRLLSGMEDTELSRGRHRRGGARALSHGAARDGPARPEPCRFGGLELLRRLLIEDENVRVVVFSMHAEPIYAARALRLGARGYVSKSAGADELVTAVKRVAEGGRYVEREVAGELAFTQLSAKDPLQQLTSARSRSCGSWAKVTA